MGIVTREQVIADLADADQTQRAHSEMPYDRMRALGRAEELPRAVKRLDVEFTVETVRAVVRELHIESYGTHQSIPAEDHKRLCLMVVLERAQCLCPKCLGRKEMYAPGAAVTQCPECNGSGKRNYRDSERTQAFGRKLEPIHESAMREIFYQYSEAERRGEGTVNAWLRDG